VVIGVLAIALVVSISVRPAIALPCQETYTEYFSDATLTTKVGEKWVTCNWPWVEVIGTLTIYAGPTVYLDPCYCEL